jgi:NDP-sugar pyrophosphorylase family protein
MQIIIPMSGIGKRFVEAGYKDPKPLIEVDGIPIIQHVVNLFPNENNISFICNDTHLKTTNMKSILNSFCPEGKIYEVPIEGRQGPVHAVSLIFEHINDDEEVIVSYCDYGTDWDYEDFLKDTRSRNADGAIACYKGFHPHMLGIDNYAFLKETHPESRWMNKIQEKQPFTDNRMEEYASNGTYYFKSGKIMKTYFQKMMNSKQTVNGEYYVSMAYNLLVDDHLKVSIFEINHMLQWGTPYDLEIYNNWSKYFKHIINHQEDYEDILDTTLILPMAGAGSRFSEKGYKDTKPFISVNDKPMIIQAVQCLPKTTNQVFICQQEHVNQYPLKKTILQYYENAEIYCIDYLTEGQACTCEIGMKHLNLDKPILISACDNGVYYNKEAYNKLLLDTSIDIIVWTFRNEPTSKHNPNMYAWLETDENDFIKNVSCKKFHETKHNLKTSHVIIGTMFFRKGSYFVDGLHANYNENIRSNNEFYVDDVLNQNIKDGLKVKVFKVEHYICWGTPDDYETYCYWRSFFDKCIWHPYTIKKDSTSK